MEDPHTRYSKRLVSNSDEPVAAALASFHGCLMFTTRSSSVYAPKHIRVPLSFLTSGLKPVSGRICVEKEPLYSLWHTLEFNGGGLLLCVPAKVSELVRRVQEKVKFTVWLDPGWDSASPPYSFITLPWWRVTVDQSFNITFKLLHCVRALLCYSRLINTFVSSTVVPHDHTQNLSVWHR